MEGSFCYCLSSPAGSGANTGHKCEFEKTAPGGDIFGYFMECFLVQLNPSKASLLWAC